MARKKGSTASAHHPPNHPEKPPPVRRQESRSSYIRVDPTLSARTGVSEAELMEMVEIFSLVDVDHGGTISKDELAQLMKTLGLKASKMELENMVNEIDVEGKGEIDFESEWLVQMAGDQAKLSRIMNSDVYSQHSSRQCPKRFRHQ